MGDEQARKWAPGESPGCVLGGGGLRRAPPRSRWSPNVRSSHGTKDAAAAAGHGADRGGKRARTAPVSWKSMTPTIPPSTRRQRDPGTSGTATILVEVGQGKQGGGGIVVTEEGHHQPRHADADDGYHQGFRRR